MVRILSAYRILSLEASLEEVIHREDGALIVQDEENWRPQEVLAWLAQKNPDLLSLPVALVPPDANGDGAVFAVDPQGEPLTDTLLFHIERRRPPMYPTDWTTAYVPT